MTVKTKTETMFSLVGQWMTSDKTQQQFCAEHDLKVGALAYWVAKHKQAGFGNPDGGFVGLDLSRWVESLSARIAYPNGVVDSCPANLPLISQLIHPA